MRARSLVFFVSLLLLAATPIQAEVVDKAPAGFHIRIVEEVPVPPAEAYDQFLRVHEWWDGSHSWFGSAAGFSIEPRAGGCFCEIDGDRSVLHMTVTFVDPGRELRMVGGLGPLQPMGLHGAMTFAFEPSGEAGTKIVHQYRVSGHAEDGLEGLADVVDRVQAGQIRRLAERLRESAGSDAP